MIYSTISFLLASQLAVRFGTCSSSFDCHLRVAEHHRAESDIQKILSFYEPGTCGYLSNRLTLSNFRIDRLDLMKQCPDATSGSIQKKRRDEASDRNEIIERYRNGCFEKCDRHRRTCQSIPQPITCRDIYKANSSNSIYRCLDQYRSCYGFVVFSNAVDMAVKNFSNVRSSCDGCRMHCSEEKGEPTCPQIELGNLNEHGCDKRHYPSCKKHIGPTTLAMMKQTVQDKRSSCKCTNITHECKLIARKSPQTCKQLNSSRADLLQQLECVSKQECFAGPKQQHINVSKLRIQQNKDQLKAKSCDCRCQVPRPLESEISCSSASSLQTKLMDAMTCMDASKNCSGMSDTTNAIESHLDSIWVECSNDVISQGQKSSSPVAMIVLIIWRLILG